MLPLKQATVATIVVGPVLDSTGAAYDSMALEDFDISKNGVNAALSGASITPLTNGRYTIALTTGNTDTLGSLVITVNKATYAMTAFQYLVMTAGSFDALVTNASASLGNLTASVATVLAAVSAISVDGSGRVLLQPAQPGVMIPSVQNVVNNVTTNPNATELGIEAQTDKMVFDGTSAIKSYGGGGGSGTIVSVVVPSVVSEAAQFPYSIQCVIGDTTRYTLTVGSIVGWTKIVMTVKVKVQDLDADAVLMIDEIAAGGGGLLIVNGEAAADPAEASLTVNDDSTGEILLVIDPTVTTVLDPATLVYSVRVIGADGNTSPLLNQKFVTTLSATRAIT